MLGSLITQAVKRGDGVTYSARAFFAEDVCRGNLVALFSEPQFGIYYISPERWTVAQRGTDRC